MTEVLPIRAWPSPARAAVTLSKSCFMIKQIDEVKNLLIIIQIDSFQGHKQASITPSRLIDFGVGAFTNRRSKLLRLYFEHHSRILGACFAHSARECLSALFFFRKKLEMSTFSKTSILQATFLEPVSTLEHPH